MSLKSLPRLLKTSVLLLLAGSAGLNTTAQTAATYTLNAFNTTYTPLTGSPLPTLLLNNSDTTLSLGFSFNFAGGTYSSITVSSNGQLSFSPLTVNDKVNSTVVADAIGPMLMPLWDDLGGDSASAAYSVTGTAPNRIFKVEYSGWRWSSSSATNAISMEVSLYETDNVIDFQYDQGPTPYDTLSGGATIGLFNNSGDWQTLPDASASPTPSSSVFTTGIDQKPASGQVYRWAAAPDATGNSFSATAYHNCTGAHMVASMPSFVAGMGVKTFYGDNNSDSTAMVAGNFGGNAVFDHIYPMSGTYTVRMLLYNGNSLVDSLQFSYQHAFCNTRLVSFYYDNNANCVMDPGEDMITQGSLTEVDSNNVPIDTIPALSGFYYTEYGNAGDIYTFRPIYAGGYYVTCPATGVLYDTMNVANAGDLTFGLSCITGNAFDLFLNASTNSYSNMAWPFMTLGNLYCSPQNTVVTLNYSPKYSYFTAAPLAATNNGQTVTWNIDSVSNNSPGMISANLGLAGPSLTVGDTVHYTFSITPTAGDTNPANNTIVIVDTIMGPFDPNHMSVQPQGYINAGTQLKYSVEFENVGNAPAHNISVLDTLPDEVDINTLNMVTATAKMVISFLNDGTHNIVRFDFPGIDLPDSVHYPHNCTGMFVYTIKAKTGLPFGTFIDNRAGIYFDYNDVVMTNGVRNIIGFPLDVKQAGKDNSVYLYPNPATDELTIRSGNDAYSSYTISNSLGQVMIQREMSGTQTKVNVKTLPAGLYYINLKGEAGNAVKKFLKN